VVGVVVPAQRNPNSFPTMDTTTVDWWNKEEPPAAGRER